MGLELVLNSRVHAAKECFNNMLPLKANYKNKFKEDVLCPLCGDDYNTSEYMFVCRTIFNVNEKTDLAEDLKESKTDENKAKRLSSSQKV